jgi:Putative beta-barrel porin-2, OmpL-like. bbp2
MRNRKRAISCHVWLMALLLCAGFATTAQAQGFGASESFVIIHGYVDLTYFDFQKGSDAVPPFADPNGISSFDQNHLTLFFGANLSQNLKFESEFHWEHALNEPELPQANMQWQLAKPLTITFGRFWLPFGTLGKHRINQPVNLLVSYPYPREQAFPFHNAQDGIRLSGDLHPMISYEAAITNGFAGLDEDAGKKVIGLGLDNNQNKEVTGRLITHPVEGMDIAGSYTTEKWDDNNEANVSFWGADLDYKLGPLQLQAEYLAGKVQNPADAVSTVDGTVRCNPTATDPNCQEPGALRDFMGTFSTGDHKRMANYVQVAYEVLNNQLGLTSAMVIVRYGQFRRDEIGHFGDRNRVTAGINIMPQPHFHLKAEYQSVSEPGGQKAVKNNGVMGQAVVDF